MSRIPEHLRELHRVGALRSVDCYLADFIGRAGGSDNKDLLLASALVSRLVADSHVCLDLEQWAGQPFPREAKVDASGNEELDEKVHAVREATVTLPGLNAWKEALGQSKMVGLPGEKNKPLVLDENRLYLQRYCQYEIKVAELLKMRAEEKVDMASPGHIGKTLCALLNSSVREGGDRQRLAAFTALRHRLAVITGGPGTGKTYTVARILALAVQDRFSLDDTKPVKIKIAAPTGKAAARVKESIREALETLKGSATLDAGVPEQIPTEASTIHRLLGTIPGSPYFRHTRENPLDADLVIIDEVSMIDLALMAKLLEALRDDTRLILLGDMDQLASVEPGSVFGDLCSAAQPDRFSPNIQREYRETTGKELTDQQLEWDEKASSLDNCLVRLYPSRRFPIEGPIGAISTAVNEAKEGCNQAAEEAWKIAKNSFTDWNVNLQAHDNETIVQWHDALNDSSKNLLDNHNRPLKNFWQAVLAGYKAYLDAETLAEAFTAMEQFRVFCALRRGPFGMEKVNRLIEEILSLKELKNVPEILRPVRRLSPSERFYHKRLVMVTCNEYSLDLFNGDMGVIWQGDPACQSLQTEKGEDNAEVSARMKYAYFPAVDLDGKQGFRRFALNALPGHETAFAMTVHKAQGSQFSKIMLVMPPDDNEQLFTRELLYTAITRPEREAILWCTEEIFKNAAKRRTRRESGLFQRLKQPG